MLNKNLKSTLTKTAAAAALTLAGAAIVNNTQNTVKAAEVTVGQQEKVVTINYLPHKSIAVWNSYGPDKQMTSTTDFNKTRHTNRSFLHKNFTHYSLYFQCSLLKYNHQWR